VEAVTKCAVVTGGSSGIGQGIAIVLAEHGYDIAITYGKNPDGAEKTRQQIEALGRRCFVYQATMPEADVPAKVIKYRFEDDVIREAEKVDFGKLSADKIVENIAFLDETLTAENAAQIAERFE
jgi:NAD(P)-dependent dehydrogenase (short-subunit alcohol dehydrogenase family)